MNHTAGPWTVERAIFDEATEDVAYILEGVKTTNVSDAHLIAAAPETKEQRDELLSVCEDILSQSQLPFWHAPGGSVAEETMAELRAAIAKARGE